MIKWPITYTDYNGETRTEEFYFNLSKPEIMELQLNANGAYGAYLKRIIQERDGKEMAKVYRELITKAYGEKTDDGRRFVKSKELTDAFMQTEAYSELYMELFTDMKACEKFFNGVFPKDWEKYASKMSAENVPQEVLSLAN